MAARPIDYSQVLNDEINGVGDIDAFVFGGAADALVSVETVGLGGGGTASFEVFGPDGTEVCSGGSFGCQLTQTGAHTILVSDSNPFDGGTVPYSLALNCLVGVCPPPPRRYRQRRAPATACPSRSRAPTAARASSGLPATMSSTDRVETTCSAAKAATMSSAAVTAEIGSSAAARPRPAVRREGPGCAERRHGSRPV